jgi:hypothetical protein
MLYKTVNNNLQQMHFQYILKVHLLEIIIYILMKMHGKHSIKKKCYIRFI